MEVNTKKLRNIIIKLNTENKFRVIEVANELFSLQEEQEKNEENCYIKK